MRQGFAAPTLATSQLAVLAATVLLQTFVLADALAEGAQVPASGGVIVRFLPNMPSAEWLRSPSWAELIVQRVDSPDATNPGIHLKARIDRESLTAIYAATLAPGVYRLDEFKSDRESCYGRACVIPRMAIGKDFSRFEVSAGHLTDLGVLIQTAAPKGGEDVLAFGPSIDSRETREIVEEVLPELAPLASDSAPSWVPETIPAHMTDLYEWALAHAVGVISPREVEDGKFIFGTSLGTLVSWQPGKSKVVHDVGVRSAIESVLVTSNGYWVVGGELGLLRISTDQGHTWHSARGNLPLGVVVSLNQWREKIVATTWAHDDLYVHSADIGASEWKELAHHSLPSSRLVKLNGMVIMGMMSRVFPRSVLVENGLITAVNDRELAYLDLGSAQEEMRELPGFFRDLSYLDGVLRCLCGKTIGMGTYESRDLGKTWRDVGNPRSLSLPVFRNHQYGIAYKRTGPWTGILAYTQDGGARWTTLETRELGTLEEKPPESFALPIGLFYSHDGSAAFALSPFGEYRISRDDGRSWEPVR